MTRGKQKSHTHSVIIPEDVFLKPSTKEISAAYLLAAYFATDITFVARNHNKTPDFLINGQYWELKSPTGNGKYNIQHALRSAMMQSSNIIIDARFSKAHIIKIKNELNYQLKNTKKIKRLLLIDKHQKILEITR